MSRPFSFASLVLLLHLAAAAAVLSQPLEPAPKAAPTALAASLHERLQELDREVRHRLERAAREGNADRREAAGLRGRLAEIERRGAELGDDERADALRRKLRALGNLVGNLERASSGDAPVSALPREPERRARSVPRTRLAAPAHDACANAVPLTFGTATSGTTVGATQDGAATCGASLASPDVWYRFTPSSYGSVSVDTFGSGYDTVVSIHSACPGSPNNQLTCNDDAYGVQSAASFYGYAGHEYWIRVSGFGGASGPFDLHLGNGGSISGTVTATADGTPLTDGTVSAYDANGYWEGSGEADSSGNFSVTALNAGAYFLKTYGFTGFFDELYDDIPCADGDCTVTSGTPVMVSSTGSVGGVDFALDLGGTISGHVTHAATGDPLTGVRVEIYDSTGSFVLYTLTDGDGDYQATGLASGSYYAVAESSAYADELYDGIACPGGGPYGCNVLTGTTIPVTAPLTTAGIDFALDRLGVISGIVTEAVTGDPISDVSVTVFDEDGYSHGGDYTDAAGAYSIGGLLPGQYVAATGTYDHVNEVFDDQPCSGYYYYYWTCDLATGTPITVALDATVSGIDFALDRYGAISGTITHALTSDPLLYAEVRLWNADGDFVDWSYTYETGTYTFEHLPAGSYFVSTDVNGDFVDELYDDLSCPGAASSGCDPTTGTPVAVSLNATTSGIDFALDPGGAIAGTVTNAVAGIPVPYATVRVYDAGGDLVRSGNADTSGLYSLAGLASGSYFVTSSASGYSRELYDDLPCPSGCDPTTGTPVAVTYNATTPGIDFALDRLGAISGTITTAMAGDPIDDARVEVWNAAGLLVDYTYSYNGSYTITDLVAGTYFVVAESYYYYYSSPFLSQLYSGVPCPGGAPAGCDPTTGTPVSVSADSTTSGIDFVVDLLGGLSGVVTDQAGAPIYDVRVRLWRAGDTFNSYDYTDSTGAYEISGLLPGTYYVATENYDGYVDEVYDNLPCLGGCDHTKGTPVNVTLGTTIRIDFALDSFAITGTVTDTATGAPLVGVTIHFWAEDDYYYPGWSTTTDSSGSYRRILPPGTYYVSTDNDVGYVDEVYDGHLCSGDSYYYGGCDPTTGTLVYVGVSGHGPLAADIDFALVDSATIFSDGFESGNVSAWSAAVP